MENRKEFDGLRRRLKRKFVKGITWVEQGLVMGHYEGKIYRIVLYCCFVWICNVFSHSREKDKRLLQRKIFGTEWGK
jgi:hypothetical protein